MAIGFISNAELSQCPLGAISNYYLFTQSREISGMFLRPNDSINFTVGHIWAPELERRKIPHSVLARSHSLEGMGLFLYHYIP